MHADGESEAAIAAYLAGQYFYAATIEQLGHKLLNEGQYLGDMMAHPSSATSNALEGIAGAIDAAVMSTATPQELADAAGRELEEFSNADIREQATILGHGVGDAAAVAVDAFVAKGVGRLARTGNADIPTAERGPGTTKGGIDTPSGSTVRPLDSLTIQMHLKFNCQIVLIRVFHGSAIISFQTKHFMRHSRPIRRSPLKWKICIRELLMEFDRGQEVHILAQHLRQM